MDEEIVNRVSESELIQLDLEEFAAGILLAEYDLAGNLYEGQIIREKEFRSFLAEHDWTQYTGKSVAVFCSADAIVPNWAYMLLAVKLRNAGADSRFGKKNEVLESLILENFIEKGLNQYAGKKVLLKGCGHLDLSPRLYLEVAARLQPLVASLMFGEACSSVPVYKKTASTRK